MTAAPAPSTAPAPYPAGDPCPARLAGRRAARTGGPPDWSTTGPRPRSWPATDPSRRFDLSRLLLTLGAAFVGVGIIWLVASNLDQLPPLTRFARGRRLLAGLPRRRRGAGGPPRARSAGDIPSPVVGCRADPRRAHLRRRGDAGGPEPAGAGVRAPAAGLVGSRRPGPRVRRPRRRPARGRPARPRVVAGVADHLGLARRADRAARPLRRRRRRGLRGRPARHAARHVVPSFAAPWREVGAVLSLGRAVRGRAAVRHHRGLRLDALLVVGRGRRGAGLAAVAAACWPPATPGSNPRWPLRHRAGRRAASCSGRSAPTSTSTTRSAPPAGRTRRSASSRTSVPPPGSPSSACCATAGG